VTVYRPYAEYRIMPSTMGEVLLGTDGDGHAEAGPDLIFSA
jgi:hypothetical protein